MALADWLQAVRIVPAAQPGVLNGPLASASVQICREAV
ncbi:hypothetical protein METH_00695 [Leisingera methylohalidivorans DSM 14336]|uniref:Uncharacterized protein n=1 Tax=Leisingera methylohalidivorans DSM 14336 TaxID=999552 RepID=V9VYL4_9RHOB|nr:hypothetical protein METH_00695 [Leisingera methylohalidivorans DSM 14336]